MKGPRVPLDELEYDQGFTLHDGLLFTGVAYERWPDGSPRWEAAYHEGYRHGPEREWFPSGQLKLERHHDAGAVHGTERAFGEDGRLVSEVSYDAGRRVTPGAAG